MEIVLQRWAIACIDRSGHSRLLTCRFASAADAEISAAQLRRQIPVMEFKPVTLMGGTEHD